MKLQVLYIIIIQVKIIHEQVHIHIHKQIHVLIQHHNIHQYSIHAEEVILTPLTRVLLILILTMTIAMKITKK